MATLAYSYTELSSHLFMNGRYQVKSKDGKPESTIEMSELMKDGELMEQSSDPKELFVSLASDFRRIVFQQLAWVTWQFFEPDKKHMPYIAFDHGPCSKVKGENLDSKGIIKEAPKLGSGYDYDGNCFYLLDALKEETEGSKNLHKRFVPTGYVQRSYKCDGAHALPGGTAESLGGHGDDFGGLSLKDFIEPSVKGWKKNGNKNNYQMASDKGSPVDSTTDAATINIPVCDYLADQDNPGERCPALGESISPGKGACEMK